MHLLTYSSFHGLTVNSQLPVFPDCFLAAESISVKQLVCGFTTWKLSAEVHCQFFCFVPCLDHLLSIICIVIFTFFVTTSRCALQRLSFCKPKATALSKLYLSLFIFQRVLKMWLFLVRNISASGVRSWRFQDVLDQILSSWTSRFYSTAPSLVSKHFFRISQNCSKTDDITSSYYIFHDRFKQTLKLWMICWTQVFSLFAVCCDKGLQASACGGKWTVFPSGFPCVVAHLIHFNLCCSVNPGKTCDSIINHCECNPCFNGGSCQNRVDGYYCHCPFGK